jgi:hypothetical protein
MRPLLQAREQFEAGSLYEGHSQAAALAWLGRWEAEVGEDPAAARDFFQASLTINPDQKEAGECWPQEQWRCIHCGAAFRSLRATT